MNPSPALSVTIAEVLVGRAEPFGPSSFSSAIRKRPVTESINLASVGFAGDEQADRRYHGGPDKAVHHYPFEHYAMWCRERPVLALQLRVGAFGENLSTRGMSEENVCVGDIFRAGSALLQVSQARQPCWKLNVRFGLNDMARLVQASGRTGWYYRVLEEGRVGRGDRQQWAGGLDDHDRPAASREDAPGSEPAFYTACRRAVCRPDSGDRECDR